MKLFVGFSCLWFLINFSFASPSPLPAEETTFDPKSAFPVPIQGNNQTTVDPQENSQRNRVTSAKPVVNEINATNGEDIDEEEVEVRKTARDVWIESGNTFGHIAEGIVKMVIPRIMEASYDTNVSAVCLSTLTGIAVGITRLSPWAIKMVDASGKPTSGILDGTASFLGSFDQCLDIEGPRSVRGQYCHIKINFPLPTRPQRITFKNRIFNFTATPLQGTILEEMGNVSQMLFDQYIRLGLCWPSTCSQDDVQQLLDSILEEVPADVFVSNCYLKEERIELTFIQWIIALSAFGVLSLAILGTSLELMDDYKAGSTKVGQYLICFSIYSNGKSLLSTDCPKGTIEALNGIKVITVAWIVWAHTYEIPIKGQFSGAVRFLNNSEKLWFQLLFNGFLSVESFFGVASFLFTYLQLKALKKSGGNINLARIVVNRVLRLSPTLWVTLLLLAILSGLSSGPFWREYIDVEVAKCTNNWMPTLLLFNNYLPISNMCLPHSWYIAVDLQLFMISLPFILLIHRYPRSGIWVTSAFLTLSITAIGIITYTNNYPPAAVATPNLNQLHEALEMVYFPTYIHLGPYFLGVIFGYFLYKTEAKLRLKPAVNLLFWALALTSSAVSLLYSHSWNRGEPWSPLSAAIYGSLHRTGWTLGVVWVSFACASGNGGFINQFLSWKGFHPLSKISYSMYLLTFPVLWAKYGYRRELIPMETFTMLTEAIVNFVIIAAASSICYIAVEGPSARMLRIALSHSFNWAQIKIKCQTQSGPKLGHN